MKRCNISALIAALVTLVCSPIASAQAVTQNDPPFTVIETTRLRNAHLGALVLSVEAQLDEAGRAFGARGVLKRGRQVVQRFDIVTDTRTFGEGRDVTIPQDVDRDGNDDFWTILEDSRNSIWLLYRFDAATAKFVRDREWTNPRVDPMTGCVVERTNGGHAGALGSLSITCWKDGAWDVRFTRDFQQTRPHKPPTSSCREDYLVKQVDRSVTPHKSQNFAFECGPAGMEEALPRWVARLYARAKYPRRTTRSNVDTP